MNTIAIITVALLMGIMGILAILTPVRFLRFVGSEPLGRDGRNEVRAVYGGFGLMMCAVLMYAVQQTDYRPGLLLCMGLALIGMALGRVISIIPDRGISTMAIVTMVGELTGGSVLLLAM